MSKSRFLNGTAAGLADLRQHHEFAGAAVRAERLRLEEPAKPMPLTPQARDDLAAVIDSLEPIQVIGGSGDDDRGRLDLWFTPHVLIEKLPTFTPESRAGLMEILNSVITEFTPGPEVTMAMGEPTRKQRIERINAIVARYQERLIAFGSPTPAQLVRKRLGVEG